jgi:hypothetical protein
MLGPMPWGGARPGPEDLALVTVDAALAGRLQMALGRRGWAVRTFADLRGVAGRLRDAPPAALVVVRPFGEVDELAALLEALPALPRLYAGPGEAPFAADFEVSSAEPDAVCAALLHLLATCP